MQPASFGVGRGRKAALTRSNTKEIKMRAYSLNELFRLTRSQLFYLHARIVAELATLPDTDRAVALETLRNIRRTLALPRNAPG
jgi:hypothetical protein